MSLFIFILGVSLASVMLVSASLCRDNYGYYKDCDTYNIANKASTPIFKGPYGNYRYLGYASGDVRPNFFFRSYGGGGYGPYFGGGYGGGYSGGYYNSFNSGVGYYGGYNNYGYGGFGYSYYRPGPYFRSYLF